jgi:predicted TPR repeat methyltransferase
MVVQALHGSPRELDNLGLVYTVTDAGSWASTQQIRRVLPVVGTALALAKSTTGIERAGEAEIAAAAKSEALAPWTQGETGREVEMLQEGKCEVDKPPPEALLQMGEHNPEAPP